MNQKAKWTLIGDTNDAVVIVSQEDAVDHEKQLKESSSSLLPTAASRLEEEEDTEILEFDVLSHPESVKEVQEEEEEEEENTTNKTETNTMEMKELDNLIHLAESELEQINNLSFASTREADSKSKESGDDTFSEPELVQESDVFGLENEKQLQNSDMEEKIEYIKYEWFHLNIITYARFCFDVGIG